MEEIIVPGFELGGVSNVGGFIMTTGDPQQGRKQRLQVPGQQSVAEGAFCSSAGGSELQESREQQASGSVSWATIIAGTPIRATARVAKTMEYKKNKRIVSPLVPIVSTILHHSQLIFNSI